MDPYHAPDRIRPEWKCIHPSRTRIQIHHRFLQFGYVDAIITITACTPRFKYLGVFSRNFPAIYPPRSYLPLLTGSCADTREAVQLVLTLSSVHTGKRPTLVNVTLTAQTSEA